MRTQQKSSCAVNPSVTYARLKSRLTTWHGAASKQLKVWTNHDQSKELQMKPSNSIVKQDTSHITFSVSQITFHIVIMAKPIHVFKSLVNINLPSFYMVNTSYLHERTIGRMMKETETKKADSKSQSPQLYMNGSNSLTLTLNHFTCATFTSILSQDYFWLLASQAPLQPLPTYILTTSLKTGCSSNE